MNLKGPGAIFLALCTELVGLVVALVYVGSILDKKYGLSGFGVAGGALIALIVWTYHLMRVNKMLDKNGGN